MTMGREDAAGIAGGCARGLAETLSCALLDTLRERRTRRVASGARILAGDLSYTTPHPPHPLNPLEEAILIVATGLTGITMMDGPEDAPGGGSELGTPFIHCLARAAASPDNSQPTHFFMINDEGIWLIKRLEGREGLALMKEMPPRWSDWSEADWLATAAQVKVRISDRRMEFPREFPYYLGWNRQLSNLPGTTMFLPVVDTTRMYVNGLLNVIDHPDGQRPLFLDDWRRFWPRTLMEWVVWLLSSVHLAPRIPYQIIGGLMRARDGWVNSNIPMPLGMLHAMLSDHESFFLQQNLMLVAEAMGLAAWVHVAAPAPHLWTVDAGKGMYGIPMRMAKTGKTWRTDPPLPSTLDNPVGLDGVLEGNCPPYVADMDEAVDRVLEMKYSAQGAYGDVDTFARAYRRPEDAQTFLRQARRYPPQVVAYAKEICRYIYDTYGRFPAVVDAMYQPGTWLQVAHLEVGYYDRFFDPAFYRRQARHAEMWGETT